MWSSMFKSKHKKVVNYRKNGAVYEIEIEGFDDEEEVRIIKNLIKDLSVNRRVFAEINGEMSAIDKKAVLRMENDSKYWFIKKLEISLERIEDINIPELLENVWTHFYFFQSSVNWKEFVEMKEANVFFKQGDLVATIYLYNMDDIWIEIGENSNYDIDKLFRQLQKENYSIKRRL